MPHKYYKWEVLALLWAAFFLNQADRQVFNTVLPLIQESMKLTAAEVGLIATVFNLVFALLVPISGYLGDRFSKKAMIVSSIVIWSSATMLTGLSTGVLMFIVFRSFATGLGEAMFGPANYSTIADYHKSTRAVAMSIHQTSYYFGVIASGFLAGYIGQRWGWRSAFLIFGAVGVLHGLVMFWRLRDKNRHEGEIPDRRNSHGLFRGADIRADRIPHLDAHVPVRKIFDEPRRRGFQLHVLHTPRGVRGDSHSR